MTKYNHDRPVSDFKEQIQKIKSKGFNLVGVSQLYLEDFYIFETKEDAKNAYNTFEKKKNGKWIGDIVGWWNTKENFLEEVEEYEKQYSKVLVHWL